MDGWWTGGTVLLSLLFLVLVIAGVVLVARAFTGERRRQPVDTPSRALTILEERYARGDIDREEFEDRRENLLG